MISIFSSCFCIFHHLFWLKIRKILLYRFVFLAFIHLFCFNVFLFSILALKFNLIFILLTSSNSVITMFNLHKIIPNIDTTTSNFLLMIDNFFATAFNLLTIIPNLVKVVFSLLVMIPNLATNKLISLKSYFSFLLFSC